MIKIKIFLLIYFFGNLIVCAQGSLPTWRDDQALGSNIDDYLMDMLETSEDQDLIMAGHTNSFSGNEVSQNTFGYTDAWMVRQDIDANIAWDRRYGGDSTDLISKVIDLSDGFLLIGSSASSASGNKNSGNNGGFDYWVIKTNEQGVKQWDRTYGGAQNDYATCGIIAPGGGGYYIGGYSNSDTSGNKTTITYGENDYWLVRIDNNGNKLWDVTYGGTSNDVMTDMLYKNGLVLGGYSDSDIDTIGDKNEPSFGNNDYWVLEVSDNGLTIEEEMVFGGTRNDQLSALSDDVNGGGYFIAGSSNSNSNGNKTEPNFGQFDYWMLKLGNNKQVEWQISLGGSNHDRATDLITSTGGSPIIAGYSNSNNGSGNKGGGSRKGSYDYWAVKIDTSGNIFWQINYGGSAADSLQSIVERCDRGLYMGGYSLSGISGDRTKLSRRENDFWLITLDIPTIPRFKGESHCFGTTMNFIDESDMFPDQWTWDFDDPLSGNSERTGRSAIHNFSGPGDYNVSLTVQEGCQQDTTLERVIEVHENRVLGRVDLGPDGYMCEGKAVILENKNSLPSDATFLWSTGETTPTIRVDTFGVFSLTVTSGECSEESSVLVERCPMLFVPNAFTPDENGLNDTWGASGFSIVEYELQIFNRWGELIFLTNDINDWWDGTYQGTLVQQDVYVYEINYTGLNGPPLKKVGTVTLVKN